MFSAMWAGVFQIGKGFDCLVVTSPPLFVGLSGYVVSRFKGIPLVFEIRDLWPESAIDTGVLTNKAIIKLAYAFENFIYRKARLINVLTPAFRDVLLSQKKVPAEKIIFIPNAADFSLSEQLMREFDARGFREQLGWSNDFVVTYVGAHGVANGLEQVVDTAALLRDTSVRFVLIGAGMQKEKVRTYAIEKGCTNVEFLDPVPKKDVFKYILASDMGASVLIKNDTFKTVYSNKTFDYMACKKPILMAIDGVSRDLVEEANAGCFVEPENPVDFSEKVLYYLHNTKRVVEQGENGYEYANRKFHRVHLAKEYIQALDKMLTFKKH
jgi:glycosyltransferase involved in cell wall biosynthesis